MNVNGHIWQFLQSQTEKGASTIKLRGGRRAGKTWTVSQFLLDRAFNYGEQIIVASMTEAQGDAGAYDDFCNIIAGNEAWLPYFDITRSPRRIVTRFKRDGRRGRVTFRSFKDPQTAKGAACDWVFINEANKFTLQQFYDLSANARKAIILDYNPNDHFWIDNIAGDELLVKWQWNRKHLTTAQLQWFENIKARALSATATSADVYYYRVYYLGEYAEVAGDIFTPANIRRGECPNDLQDVVAHCDPSALWGNDYFACVLSGCKDGVMYVPDTYSINIGHKNDIVLKLREWAGRYKNLRIVIEVNGSIGQDFYRHIEKEFMYCIEPIAQNRNKFERIMANYENICERVVFAPSDVNNLFLEQVYTFGKKCEHDDNIDAINTSYDIHRWGGYV